MMSSNVNSLGVPVDHDGMPLEDGVLGANVAPFAVNAAVFEEIFSGSGKDVAMKSAHLEADGHGGIPSSCGGIPLETVTVEDYVSSDDEPLSPNSAFELCKNNTSATVHAMMKSTKHERDALGHTQRKLSTVLKFLKAKGFSEEAVFSESMPTRDDLGLPFLTISDEKSTDFAPGDGVPDPFKDKMKKKLESPPPVASIPPVVKVLDEKSEGDTLKKSWSQVVNDASPQFTPVKFDFIQLPPGNTLVSPPMEVLKQGNEKFKNCLVGTFSKGFLPFAKVTEFARKAWGPKGLIHVSQKDSHNFLFKFSEVNDVNSILARGTWFVERRPLLLHRWGTNPCQKSTTPLWVKFENIPDSYWTREGLSWLASCIGKPLCADTNTSRLEVLPFAKLCVEYNIGNELPTSLDVEVLDPVSEKIMVEKVLVSYPAKPLICNACKSLGHLVGACPKVTRQWVRKDSPDKLEQPQHSSEINKKDQVHPVLVETKELVGDAQPEAAVVSTTAVQDDSDWHQVKRKNSAGFSSSGHPHSNHDTAAPPVVKATPADTMPIYSALSRTLSKNQRKKAKKSGGKSPPFKQ